MTMASDTLLKFNDSNLNAKDLIESHFSNGEICIIEENVGAPLKLLNELFSSGKVKGDKLLDISAAGLLFPLFSAVNAFKEIYIMTFTDSSEKHCKKWLKKEEGAIDWSFVSKRVCQLEGNVVGFQEKEEKLRKAIKGVIRCDIVAGSVDSVVLPQVDCVMAAYSFNVISHNKEDIPKNLRTMTSTLKNGGHLVLFVGTNMSFFRVGQQKFSVPKVDEKFVKETVINSGFVIETEEVILASIENDIADYKNVLFLVARKEETS